jgi:hypothetical protein
LYEYLAQRKNGKESANTPQQKETQPAASLQKT